MVDEIPIIDIEPFRFGNASARRRVAADVSQACEGVGFLTVTGHGVPSAIVEEAFAQGFAFFDQPDDEKWAAAPPDGQILRGYSGMAKQSLARSTGATVPPDLRESFMLGRPELTGGRYADRPEAALFYRPNVWPAQPAAFRPALEAYYREMEKLSVILMRVFAVALKQPDDFFDGAIDDHFSALGVHHYPVLSETAAPGQLRAGAHTDFGSLTILRMTEAAGGLEVRAADGRWLALQPQGDGFVINIGDLMAQWSNDRWKSTAHRVALPPPEQAARRLSLGYFCHPNYDQAMRCLPGCSDAQHPPKYPETLAGDYMRAKILAVRHEAA